MVLQRRKTNRPNTNSAVITNNGINMPDYFRSNTKREADREASRILMKKIHNDFSDVFTGISCFNGTFKLQMREGSHLYQAPPRRVAFALLKPLSEELDRLQKQQIIVPLDVVETSECCNSFMLVPKQIERLAYAWIQLVKKVILGPIHRGSSLNDILPRLAGFKYFIPINMSFGYYKLKLDEESS